MTMSLLRVPAPAKLNLFLHITGRRADGYHTLQTVFQLIDWCDWLTFERLNTPEIRLTTDLAGVPAADNLIIRAATLLQQHTQSPYGCAINLEKNLPMGGGLGGGSSDAATTLLALNHLWQTGLSLPALAHLGLRLGADVPVFVLGQNAFAEGVGEQLTPISLPKQRYVVLKPDCFVSTQQLFAEPRLTRDTAQISVDDYGSRDAIDSKIVLKNDCQSVACALFPPIKAALDYLQQYGAAMMTGTGACVFVAVLPHDDAQMILRNAPCAGYVCESLDVSPVHGVLGDV